MKPNLEILKNFTEQSLPDLDTVLLGALEYLDDAVLPEIMVGGFKKMLVVGSGNALTTGRVLFAHCNAIFHDESTYQDALTLEADIDAVCVISASGGKHAIEMVKTAVAKDLPTFLITNTKDSLAGALLDPSCVIRFPKIREPYTYNTSTYLGMLLAHGGEDPTTIHDFITEAVAPRIPETFAAYDAFFLIVPSEFDTLRDMFGTKFDELFGPLVVGRVFTLEQAKHAKTVVPSASELFISFGEENTMFGTEAHRLTLPLPQNAGPAAMLAVSYYTIGCIQKQFPPYFKDNIAKYAAEASQIFGHQIPVIVE